MKKLFIILSVALLFVSCGKKKEIDPELYKEGVDMAKYRMAQLRKEDLSRFLAGTNKNENVSLSVKDSILTVKIISKEGVNYDDFVESYHDLAHRSNVWITGTELRDSLTGKVLARIGYGFKTRFDE